MNHLKSAFYVFTWAFVFTLLFMAVIFGLASIFIPKFWFLVLPTATGSAFGSAIVNMILQGRPLDNGDVFNPWLKNP